MKYLKMKPNDLKSLNDLSKMKQNVNTLQRKAFHTNPPSTCLHRHGINHPTEAEQVLIVTDCVDGALSLACCAKKDKSKCHS
jgi:hypothetical protein